MQAKQTLLASSFNMADIITAFGLTFLLYKELGTDTEGSDPVSPDLNLLYMALFMVFGFLVGNIGSDLASKVTLGRMLWPERYYHTTSPWKLAMVGLTMSAAGAFQAAGKQAIDRFLHNGLFKGAKEGDMLGTAFFEDSRTGYRAFAKREGQVEPIVAEDARNNFWAAVIASLCQQNPATSGIDGKGADFSRTGEFANRRVFHLKINDDELRPSTNKPYDINKINIKATLSVMLVGAIFSEISSVLTGAAAAVVWHSPFAMVWFVPLLLRLLAIRFRVRRTPLLATEPKCNDNNKSRPEPYVFELDDHKHGFVLIEAPEALGLQFFRHFGHPQRSNLSNDRRNECISMALVVAAGAYFPTSWVAFAFAPSAMRWTWVYFQICLLAAQLVPTYSNLLLVGSLEEAVAEALRSGKLVYLGDDDTGHITVSLEKVQASRIAEAREIVESKKLEILGIEKKEA